GLAAETGVELPVDSRILGVQSHADDYRPCRVGGQLDRSTLRGPGISSVAAVDPLRVFIADGAARFHVRWFRTCIVECDNQRSARVMKGERVGPLIVSERVHGLIPDAVD